MGSVAPPVALRGRRCMRALVGLRLRGVLGISKARKTRRIFFRKHRLRT
jgi:hypothetical protein